MIYEIYTENGTKKKRALTGNGYGLPLGTWISYEGTCPDGFIESEQTFNTTTYASLYAMLGTNKVPARFDHSVLSDLESFSYSANTDIEMQYDGILYVTKKSANSNVCEIKIDGVLVTSVYTNANAYSYANISFRKGQVLNISYAGTDVVVGVMYYKRHLAIKATPAYVEPDTVSAMVNTLRTQDSYSTEEVNTGKKWIDGKPIYRKVFTGLNIATTSDGWFATNIDSSDIDCIVHSQMIGIDVNALYQENEFECNGMVAVNKNTKKLDIITSGYHVSVKKIVLEYTKTTD